MSRVQGLSFEELQDYALELEDDKGAMLNTLKQIERWEMPVTDSTWAGGSPMSFRHAFGAKGEQEHIRRLARHAIERIEAK